MKFCSTCQEEFADKFSFCPVDGTPLLNGDVRQSEALNQVPVLLLTGPEQRKLRDALCDAFDSESFRWMLFYGLDKELEDIAPINAPFEIAVANVVYRANMEAWLYELILKAHRVKSRKSRAAQI